MTASRVLFSFREAAKQLNMRRDRVSAMVRDGRIRTVDVEGTKRIPLVEIERIQREGIPAANAPKPRRRRAPMAPIDPSAEIRSIKI